LCYQNTTTLTTGNFGEWKTEQTGVGYNCSNSNADYWLNININGVEQSPRRLLNSFKSLRRDTSALTPSYNYSGFARWSVQNTNSDNTSGALFSVMNDVGNTLTLTMTGSNYFSTENNISFNNQPSIGQSSFNDLYFVNGRHTGFSWLNNPFNDTSNIVQSIMNLDESGNLNISGNITGNSALTIAGSIILEGTFSGLSSLKLQDEINFIKSDGTITSALYNAPRTTNSTLPSDFADSLIHDIIQETNNFGMQECFWDENTETMQLCISGAYLPARATTISRSLQVVGNTTNKPVNENFTLCEGNNYIDCNPDITGADLLVEDDIEAIGSIFSQENITADDTGFFNFLGSLTNRITKLWVIDIDASRDIIVGRNLEVLGNVEINGTLELSGNVEVGGNLEVGGNMEVAGCIEYNGGSLGTCI